MKILDLPLRFATFLVLICIFFATDFVYLWDLSFSVNWTPFLIVSLILFLTFVYHKRKALKTLATVSESNVTKGGILLLLALIIYVLGSYVDNLFFFHYFALILFSMACLFLGFDRRIPKILLIPMVFVLLIFMIPFTIEIVTFNGNIALNFLTVYLIGTFLLAIMAITLARQFFATRKDRRGKTQQKNSGCPMCKSQKFKDVVFCYWCGQQLLKPKPNTIKNFAIRFLLIYLIVGVLLFANVPTFSIENGEALTTLYTIRGRQKQSLIQMPNGWILNSSTRLVDYERVYNEDFATLTTYISHGGGNVFSILLEVSSQKPYAMNDWKLPNWQKVSEEIVFLDEKTLGHLIFLQKN
ncbi:MAG: hypothetical protein QXH37_05920, partial [Candidatus Bathyarchaeia archaeon]